MLLIVSAAARVQYLINLLPHIAIGVSLESCSRVADGDESKLIVVRVHVVLELLILCILIRLFDADVLE